MSGRVVGAPGRARGDATPTHRAGPARSNAPGEPTHVTDLRDRVAALAGFDLSDVRIHRSSSLPHRFDADALARGNEIHVGSGADHLIAHELWHVVQQRQGRVRATTVTHDHAVNDDDALEREADVMAVRARAAPVSAVAPLEDARVHAADRTSSPVAQLGRGPQRRPRRFGAGSRQTMTARRARAGKQPLEMQERARRLARFAGVRGSYAQQYVDGGARVNRGRRALNQLRIEVDHIPTDSSQRGNLARDDPRNRDETMLRPAAALPRTWHRKHPTTIGGPNTDHHFRQEQQALVNDPNRTYTDPGGVQWSGFAGAMAQHLDAYDPVVDGSSRTGIGVYKGARQNMKDALAQAHARHHLSPAEHDALRQKVKYVFRNR